MSQSSFLTDLSLWNKEECYRQCEVALPKLVNFVEKEEHSLDLIQKILHNFATACSASSLEQKLFRRLAKKISSNYDYIFEEISVLLTEKSDQVQGVQAGILSWLQTAVSVVEGLELCIREVFLACATLQICHVHSLLPTVVHIIHESYDHCKESSVIYRDLLIVVSDQLSVLFKKVHVLQMTFLNLVDKLAVTSSSSECDLEDMAEVLQGLHSISEVAMHLDVKITVTVWKALSRLACLHKTFLRDKINYSSMLVSLCTNMTSAYDYLVQSLPMQTQEPLGNDKGFVKNIKILGFQMKILVKFVEEFGPELSRECVEKIVCLILHIQRLSPPHLEARNVSQHYLEEIQKQLTNGVEPLVKRQISNATFVQCVTAKRNDSNTCGQGNLSSCLILLTVAECLITQPVDVLKLWISPDYNNQEVQRCSLIQAIFSTLADCYVELRLPVYVPASFNTGTAQSEVSLYEWICTKLCALVAVCPAQCFHVVETSLLEQVLQPATHNALLAVDVWCFLARFGSAELCRDHCLFLSKLVIREGLTSTPQCCHLLVLLRRLTKFLAPEHHESFVKEVAVCESSFPVWSVFPLHTLMGSLGARVVTELVHSCTQYVQKYTDSPRHRTAANTLVLDTCLRCLSNVAGNTFVSEKHLNPTLVHKIQNVCVSLLQIFRTDEIYKYTLLQKCGADLLIVLSSLTLDNIHVHMVLEFIHHSLKQCATTTGHENSGDSSSDVLHISALHFLQSLSKKRFPPGTKQPEILHLLPRIFTSLLSHHNPVVRTEALRVFSEFAEETAHETVVTSSLNSDQDVQHRVVTYLNKLANKKPAEPPDISTLKAQHASERRFCEADINTIYKPAVWPKSDSTEPLCKRIKLDSTSTLNETQLASAVEGVKDNVYKIEQAVKISGKELPVWMKTELKHCRDLLSNLL